MVIAAADEPFQPLAKAHVRKLRLVWLLEIVAVNAFDLPQKFVGIVICPLATPARLRTAVSFRLICVVPLPPFSN
jgi:hypothetical protein